MSRHRAPRPPRRRTHPMDRVLAGVALAAVTGFVSVLGSIDERHRVGVPVASRAAPSLPHSHAEPLGPPLPVSPFVAGWSGPVSVGGMVAAPPVLGAARLSARNVKLPDAPVVVEKPVHNPPPTSRPASPHTPRPTSPATSQPAPTPPSLPRPEPRADRTAPDWWRDVLLRIERPTPTPTPSAPSPEPDASQPDVTESPETSVSAPPSATETTEENQP